MNAFGVHGCSVVTALTAQNTVGVSRVEPVSAAMLRAQLDALRADLPPAAIKIGMLGGAEGCETVADFLNAPAPPTFVVCDPVLQSTSGTPLLEGRAAETLMRGILPRVDLLTPNRPEAEALTGRTMATVESAARELLSLGPQSVLIKGGHAEGDRCRDYWTDGRQSLWLSSPRIDTRHTHGTGCILSSAIAASAALGRGLPEALIEAKTFLNQCLRSPAGVGTGHGPMWIGPFRNDEQDRPETTYA